MPLPRGAVFPTEEMKRQQITAAKLVNKINRTPRGRTHVSEISQAIISEFGGAAGFAREFHAVYLLTISSKNTAQRVNLLKAAAKLLEIDTEMNGRGMSVGEMDEEGIKLEMTDLLQVGMQSVGDEDLSLPGLTPEQVEQVEQQEQLLREVNNQVNTSLPSRDPDEDEDEDEDDDDDRSWDDCDDDEDDEDDL